MKTVEKTIQDYVDNAKELLVIVNEMINQKDYSRFSQEQLEKFKNILIWSIESNS